MGKEKNDQLQVAITVTTSVGGFIRGARAVELFDLSERTPKQEKELRALVLEEQRASRPATTPLGRWLQNICGDRLLFEIEVAMRGHVNINTIWGIEFKGQVPSEGVVKKLFAVLNPEPAQKQEFHKLIKAARIAKANKLQKSSDQSRSPKTASITRGDKSHKSSDRSQPRLPKILKGKVYTITIPPPLGGGTIREPDYEPTPVTKIYIECLMNSKIIDVVARVSHRLAHAGLAEETSSDAQEARRLLALHYDLEEALRLVRPLVSRVTDDGEHRALSGAELNFLQKHHDLQLLAGREEAKLNRPWALEALKTSGHVQHDLFSIS